VAIVISGARDNEIDEKKRRPEMFPFIARAGEVEGPTAQDKIVWRLLDAPTSERQFVLMTALRDGELRLSEASDALLTVDRIESLGRPIRRRQLAVAGGTDPYWQQAGRRRFVF
jgi:hypothetical protein